jgi:hypothetical protein
MRDKTTKVEGGKKRPRRTDIVYNGVELGLVSSGEEDVESSSSKLDRKLPSDAVRCARDDYSNDEEQSQKTRHVMQKSQSKTDPAMIRAKKKVEWNAVEKGVPGITHLPMRPSLLQTS